MVAPSHLGEWQAAAGDLPLQNLFVQSEDLPPLDGVTRVLRAILAREPFASIVLIPADHCAAIESAWVLSARSALRLARDRPGTVYLLHDQIAKDERPFDAALDLCSSTVIVGSAESLVDLCEGKKATQVLDLMADEKFESVRDEPPTDAGSERPVNLVHVRLVEEYERIQNGSHPHAKSTGMHLRA